MVTFKEKKVLYATYVTDTDDPYCQCIWALFIIEPDTKTLTVRTNEGVMAYTWEKIGDNTPKGFLKFLAGLDEEYLLSKLSEKTEFNFEKTRKSMMVLRAGFPQIVKALRKVKPFRRGEDFANWYLSLPDTHSDDLEAIVMDYPINFRIAMDVFAEQVQPKLREML